MAASEHDLYLTVIKAIRGNVEELRAEALSHRARISDLEKALYKLSAEMAKLADLATDVKELTRTLGGTSSEDGLVQKLRQLTRDDHDVKIELTALQKDLQSLKRTLMITAIAGGAALVATQDITKWIHILKILL
jgi:chromosome segregation ATPase